MPLTRNNFAMGASTRKVTKQGIAVPAVCENNSPTKKMFVGASIVSE